MYNLIQKRPLCLNKIDVIEKLSYCDIINNIFGPTEFALIWVEVRMFRAFLLVKRVTSTNSEAFSNPRLVQIRLDRKCYKFSFRSLNN